GRVRVFLLEGSDVRAVLEVAGIDTCARRVQQSPDATLSSGFNGVQVDEGVISDNHRFVALDETDAAHLGREGIDLVHATCSLQAVFPSAQVERLERVGNGWLELRRLDVDAAHPI